MKNLEALCALGVVGGTWAVAYYFGTRRLYLYEKKKNIINGIYAALFLDEKKCSLHHKIFFLGKPSESIRSYILKHPEEVSELS